MADRTSRRRVLRSGVALGAVSLVGCLSLGSDGGGDDSGGDADGNGTSDGSSSPSNGTDPDTGTDGSDGGNGTDSDDGSDPDDGTDPDEDPTPSIERWPQYQYDAGNTGYAEGSGPTENVEEVWTKQVEPQITASPLVADSTLFVTDYSGTVHALDTDDGSEVWTVDLGETGDRTGAIHEDQLIVPTHEAIYGLELESGDQRWRTPNGGKATHLTLVDGMVAFANRNQTVRALDAGSGEELWRSDAPENAIEHGLAYDGESFIAHDRYHSIYKFGPGSGVGRRYAQIDGGFDTVPTVRDGALVVGGTDGAYHCYDLGPQQISERWGYQTKQESLNSPSVTDEHIIFTDGEKMAVLRLGSGKRAWERETTVFAPMLTTVLGDTAYVSTGFGMVEGRSLSNGELAWEPDRTEPQPTGNLSREDPLPAFSSEEMYACGKSGQVRSFANRATE